MKIVECSRLEDKYGKFKFKCICRKLFVSIINCRNTGKGKLITEHGKIRNEKMKTRRKTIKTK